MADLFNTTTRQPETVPDDQLNNAIIQGTHAYPEGTRVNVVDAQGKASSVESHELQDALKQGYQVETPKQAAVRGYLEDNAGASGTVKAALGKFADEAAMGIPGIIYDKTGDPLEVAKWDALKKEHSTAAGIGAVGGFGASLFTGAPVFKAAGVAGEAAAKTVAERLAAAGIERGADSTAKDLVARAAESATKLGVEGAAISAPRAITEGMLGDPEQAGETLLYGAGIGATLGLAGGVLAKPFEAMKGKMADALERAKGGMLEAAPEAAETAAVPATEMTQVDPNSASLSDVVQASDAAPEVKKTFATQLMQQRDDAPEIQQAFEDIGGKATEGSLSRQKAVREFESTVVNDPGLVVGQGVRDQHAANWQAVSNAAGAALGTGEEAGASKFATGEAVKASLINKVEGRGEEFAQKYGDVENQFERVPVSDRAKATIARNIMNMDEVASAPGSATAQHLKGAADDLLNAKIDNLKQLKITSTAWSKTTNPDLKFAASIVREKLADLEEASIKRYADTMKTPKARQSVLDYLENRRTTNLEYAKFKDEMGELGKAIGRKRVRGAGDFGDILEDIPSEQLAGKLFAVKNPKFLGFLSEKFPEEFNALVGLEKRQIIEKATVDGQVMPAKVFGMVSKYSPEVQQIILGEKAPLYASAKKAFESMPTQINPSGTTRMQAYREAMTVGGAVKNAAAYAKLAAMKSPHALIYVEQAMKNAAQKLDMIPDAIDSMTKATGVAGDSASIGAISRIVEGSKDRQAAFKKLSEEITSSVADPDKASNRISNASSPFQQGGAPNIANAFNAKMTNALQYLNSQLPKPITPPNPLIKHDFQPSDAQLSAFDRKLHVVMDPFSVVEDLKNGSLTQDQVQTLQAVYPKLYEQVQSRIIHHISTNEKTVPYGARLKLSMLMGTPLDPSLSQGAIAGFQNTFAQEQAQQNQGAASGSKLKTTLAQRTGTQFEK